MPTKPRKRALPKRPDINAALKESEERYRLIVSALVEGVVIIDADGHISAANSSAEKILGFSAAELKKLSVWDPRWGVLKEDGTPSHPDDYFTVQSLRTGKSFANLVIGLRRRDGQLIWLNGNTQPLFRTGEKKPYAVVTSFFDITNRKEMEAEIHRLNVDLEQKVELRTAELKSAVTELEAFSYSVSHDLRAPLRAIKGFTDILLDEEAGALDEKGKHLLKSIEKNTAYMTQLIHDLLTFSRVARKDFVKTKVPMQDLAKVVTADIVPKDSPIHISMAALPDALGDAVLLRQVWTNLLSNAVKFTRDRKDPRIEIGFQDQPYETVYFVKDNGVGFDMQYVWKLFGVFQRLHTSLEFEGTGVGLAIVQRIIHKHGGRTWAEGRVNQGATFYFSLPK